MPGNLGKRIYTEDLTLGDVSNLMQGCAADALLHHPYYDLDAPRDEPVIVDGFCFVSFQKEGNWPPVDTDLFSQIARTIKKIEKEAGLKFNRLVSISGAVDSMGVTPGPNLVIDPKLLGQAPSEQALENIIQHELDHVLYRDGEHDQIFKLREKFIDFQFGMQPDIADYYRKDPDKLIDLLASQPDQEGITDMLASYESQMETHVASIRTSCSYFDQNPAFAGATRESIIYDMENGDSLRQHLNAMPDALMDIVPTPELWEKHGALASALYNAMKSDEKPPVDVPPARKEEIRESVERIDALCAERNAMVDTAYTTINNIYKSHELRADRRAARYSGDPLALPEFLKASEAPQWHNKEDLSAKHPSVNDRAAQTVNVVAGRTQEEWAMSGGFAEETDAEAISHIARLAKERGLSGRAITPIESPEKTQARKDYHSAVERAASRNPSQHGR